MVSVRILIWGKVQGVFFRQSAKDEADKLGLAGWVRNNPDGTVEIEAEGNKVQLVEFIKWSKKGPPFAKVEKVEVEWKKNLEDLEDFSIF